MICRMANSLWAAGCIPESMRFRSGARHVAVEQEAILRRVLDENAGTEFGKAHGFSSIRCSEDFRQRVPLRDYDEHQPWIHRAADGSPNVLTRGAIRLFEPTSGSSGATKLIPYTSALQVEFQRGINAWIADLFTHFPKLLGGPAYWSISPVNTGHKSTPGGIPIGFDDDTSYLGGWRKRLVQAVMAVPGSVRFAGDSEAFRYATLLHLVRARNLRLISIWSPTFLTLLLDQLGAWGDRMVHDLAHGNHCAVNTRRSREVREALQADSPQETYARLWPNLELLSCWRDATSTGPAAALAALFPRSRMQGKGLIATEAFISFPLIGHEDAALAVRSHFLEFLSSASDRTVLAHELERGGLYAVAVTTGGGLYRYLLGDQIEVTGHIHDCPLVRFVGREGSVSDRFGEKLNDAHVSRVFDETFKKLGIVPTFSMLACDTARPAAYVLYIDAAATHDQIARAAEGVETGLCENFHYGYARSLGQLAPVRVMRVPNGAKAFFDDAVRNGQKLGDVKVPALDRRCRWSEVFRGAGQIEAGR
jgi:hypothetical protein